MPGESQKQFLFVDDDPAFLQSLKELFTGFSGGRWTIVTAENHAQALAHLSRQLTDVVVLDIGMPVMDGLEFLRLLHRTHPGQQVVMLTSRIDATSRQTALEQGAALFLQKPLSANGFQAVYAALDALATAAAPQTGFRGVMRRVGLQEIIQMECLSKKSSVLDVYTRSGRGRIIICDGAIIHAESGELEGEVALYGLLGLQEGEFNFRPYAEPPRRTISAPYEFLLMEAARLTDETAGQTPPVAPPVLDPEPSAAAHGQANNPGAPLPAPARIQEILLCSGSGELLYQWDSPSPEKRISLLAEISHVAQQISALAPAGRFERLEVDSSTARTVCRFGPNHWLLVRRTGHRCPT
jgi:CheY-like chemotaxis protein